MDEGNTIIFGLDQIFIHLFSRYCHIRRNQNAVDLFIVGLITSSVNGSKRHLSRVWNLKLDNEKKYFKK